MYMPTQIDGETYLNTSETLGKLSISRPTLDALVKSKQLKRYKQGIRSIAYYKLSELERLLEFREDTNE